MEENLRKNNSKRAPTGERLDQCGSRESDYCPRSFRKMPHGRATDTEAMDSSDLYNHKANGDPLVLTVSRQSQRMTTPSFAKKWRLQCNQ